jgi:cell division protein FtsA
VAHVFSDRMIVAIDVGTTKICVLVAQKLCDDQMTIVGIGKAPSEGLKKGVVVNIGQTVKSIKSAVKEAELMSGMSITSAYIGISGSHIHSINSQGAVPIKRGIVRAQDISNVISAAQAIPIPEGQHILHVLPQYFVVDNQERVNDPIGMHGVRLEVMTHIITGATALVADLVSCCEQAGVDVRDVILEPIASAAAVLTPDEQELGVGILDIGGGTSDFAVYQHGTIRHTKVVPIAGTQFTRDIAIGLRTPLDDAERIKREYGAADLSCIEKDIMIDAASIQGPERQKIQQEYVVSILNARAQELLEFIKHDMDTFDIAPSMAAGIVLTGGGALLRGLDTLAHNMFHMPVRVGMPKISFDMPVTLKSPIYATGYGLLLSALTKGTSRTDSSHEPFVKRMLSSMKSWVSDFF